MPIEVAEIVGRGEADGGQSGFTDTTFNARYDGVRSTDSGRARAPAPGLPAGRQVEPAPLRSRNAYMRARARRRAAP